MAVDTNNGGFSRRAKLIVGVLALAIVAAIAVVALGAGSEDGPLKVEVYAKQYSWSFGYPEENAFSKKDLHVPLDREVEFQMHTQDQPHGFWVPEWEIKEDIGPGAITTLSLTPDKAGAYRLICSVFCGIEHAFMRTKIVVESEGEFDEWVGDLKREIPPQLAELSRLDTELESIHQDGESNP
jgi:heme/copper-type cytochrome/quinol oxidase subunit 2